MGSDLFWTLLNVFIFCMLLSCKGSCETTQTRASFHYSRMQWIKTNVDCVSTSAECPCVLNANNKGSGEIVKWPDLFWLWLLALYAINHVSKAHARCQMKLLTLWRWYLFANSLEPGRDCRAWSESKLFGTLTANIVFFCSKKLTLKKINRRQRSALPSRSRVRLLHYITS